MAERPRVLQTFLVAARTAFRLTASDQESRDAVDKIFTSAESVGEVRDQEGLRLPVCGSLDAATSIEPARAELKDLVEAFRALEPHLVWRKRMDTTGTASANFTDGHANAMILGPNGLEQRDDLWLGVSLLAPHVRYPDHDHAPEEVYLVLSEGEFQHGDSDWFSPGIGGSFYNSPGIRHAMRSGSSPLFAFWCLRPEGE